MDWVQAWQPETPDVERARKLAWDAMLDSMHFHELAMAEPFKAERVILTLCEEILLALGHPTGVLTYTVTNQSAENETRHA